MQSFIVSNIIGGQTLGEREKLNERNRKYSSLFLPGEDEVGVVGKTTLYTNTFFGGGWWGMEKGKVETSSFLAGLHSVDIIS